MTQAELEALWEERFGSDPSDEPPVCVGEYLPGKVASTALTVADEWAARHGVIRWPEYLREFTDAGESKPTKPSADMLDDVLRRFPPENPAHAPYFRYALEQDELARYFNNLRDYEQRLKDRERFRTLHTPDAAGYLQCLAEKNEALARFFFERYRTLPISEHDRERHTYIVGGTGSGKSELVKVILYHYLTENTAPALVVIDPHGDLSRQVARWPELAGGSRLAYIAPGIGKRHAPVFNPFDIPDTERTEDAVSILVDDTIEIVAELLEKDFTTNMETLLRACFTVFFHRPGSTFADVLRFVDKKNNADFLELAERVFPAHSPLLRFIRHDLESDSLGPTRQAVKMRFTSLLSRHFFYSFLVGKSTFRLEELLRQRACVIFNLSKSEIGTRECRIFGRFILAHLRAFAFKQGRGGIPERKRIPVHVFVDECQEFITESIETILAEARKYRVYLTLVQQTIGKGMSRELLETVLANTSVKASGRNSEANRKAFAAEVGIPIEELEKLERGAGLFCIRSGNRPPVIVKVPGHRLRDKGAVPAEAWEHTLADQITRFYAHRDGGHDTGALAEAEVREDAHDAAFAVPKRGRPQETILAAPAQGPGKPIDY
ncbi:MAG TPA: DUF87 domain-containing protein [Magnetospirillum sp.]|nr:DUF87 domain-containing protein [Magnetospirillum sp.]